jgi:Cu(I)/Ag(I) efflux system membrane fusion protein
MDKNKIKEIGKHPYFRYGLILLTGLLLACLFFRGNNRNQSSNQTTA